MPFADANGREHAVRLLMTEQELRTLQAAGVVPADVTEIIGMQQAADIFVADIEKQNHVQVGGMLS